MTENNELPLTRKKLKPPTQEELVERLKMGKAHMQNVMMELSDEFIKVKKLELKQTTILVKETLRNLKEDLKELENTLEETEQLIEDDKKNI